MVYQGKIQLTSLGASGAPKDNEQGAEQSHINLHRQEATRTLRHDHTAFKYRGHTFSR